MILFIDSSRIDQTKLLWKKLNNWFLGAREVRVDYKRKFTKKMRMFHIFSNILL